MEKMSGCFMAATQHTERSVTIKVQYNRIVITKNRRRTSVTRQVITDCYDAGDWEGAVSFLETTWNLTESSLVELYNLKPKQGWDSIIEKVVNDHINSIDVSRIVLKSVRLYCPKDDLNRAIKDFEKLETKNLSVSLLSQLEAYTLKYDFDSVIKVFQDKAGT